MLKIEVSRQARKFTPKLPAKHQRQIVAAIDKLVVNPYPHDSIQIQGRVLGLRRVSVGEYRIIYHIENDVLFVDVIGKRNDDSVYKILEMKF
ncbi:MAG: type II toxin-antitoxin system RelE/ParE family toxin [Pseudomonadota bacterium]